MHFSYSIPIVAQSSVLSGSILGDFILLWFTVEIPVVGITLSPLGYKKSINSLLALQGRGSISHFYAGCGLFLSLNPASVPTLITVAG